MDEMPTLGRPPRRGLAGATLVLGALGGAAVTYALLHARRPAAPPPPPSPPIAIHSATVDAAAPDDAAGASATAEPAGTALVAGRPTHVHATIDGPLEAALVRQVGRALGLPLTQVTVRALAWWVRVPDDLRRGDTVDLLVEDRPGEEPQLDAVRFQSGKLGKTFAAYRWQPPGEKFPRFYQPGGEELELRLEDAPLDDYEQVTSLLRDGRGHKGVDFKTPVGTPVKAPFDGTIARRTWKFAMNGNSLELKESGGEHRSALMLHLSEATANVGDRVRKGEVIGKSGNTGHSFAPHLHYQLMSSANQVLDPFQSQPTLRRRLSPSELPAFEQEQHRLDALLSK